MKTKAKLILKSLADLPANTLTLAASVPGRALASPGTSLRRRRRPRGGKSVRHAGVRQSLHGHFTPGSTRLLKAH